MLPNVTLRKNLMKKVKKVNSKKKKVNLRLNQFLSKISCKSLLKMKKLCCQFCTRLNLKRWVDFKWVRHHRISINREGKNRLYKRIVRPLKEEWIAYLRKKKVHHLPLPKNRWVKQSERKIFQFILETLSFARQLQ
jgi:hypothetical protein